MDIENDRFVYFKSPSTPALTDFIHSKLLELGFQKNRILDQSPSKFGQIGDYIALILEYSPENMVFIVGKIKKDRKFVGLKPLIDLPTDLVDYDILISMNIDVRTNPECNSENKK